MKTKLQQKVYKITYGSMSFEKDQRVKVLKNQDNFMVDSITIIATDAYDALEKAEHITLEKEKEWLKEYEQLFIESVEMVEVLTDIS